MIHAKDIAALIDCSFLFFHFLCCVSQAVTRAKDIATLVDCAQPALVVEEEWSWREPDSAEQGSLGLWLQGVGDAVIDACEGLRWGEEALLVILQKMAESNQVRDR